MTSGGVMAKKKRKPGPKPSPEGPRTSIVALKCRDEWKEWLSRYAEKRRVNPSQLIDIALEALAEQDDFEAPPKR